MTSSNCFANGANQNAGNVITDRSTTRIHHAPGGASSICLGDGSSDGMFTKRSLATPTSAASAQPTAPQATSVPRPKTPQQIYAEELRLQIETKKAMAAGKKLSDVFAERADEVRVQREAVELQAQVDHERAKQREREGIVDQRSNQLKNYLAQEENPPCSKGSSRGVCSNNTNEHKEMACNSKMLRPCSSKDATVSSNKFACGANQNCGNIITDRSTTRIHHAPGGKSSLVLG